MENPADAAEAEAAATAAEEVAADFLPLLFLLVLVWVASSLLWVLLDLVDEDVEGVAFAALLDVALVEVLADDDFVVLFVDEGEADGFMEAVLGGC